MCWQIGDIIVKRDILVLNIVYVFFVVRIIAIFILTVSAWFCVANKSTDWVTCVDEVPDPLSWFKTTVFVAL